MKKEDIEAWEKDFSEALTISLSKVLVLKPEDEAIVKKCISREFAAIIAPVFYDSGLVD